MSDIIVKVNGEPYTTESSARQQMKVMMLSDVTYHVTRHRHGYAITKKKNNNPLQHKTRQYTSIHVLHEANRKRDDAMKKLQECDKELAAALEKVRDELGEHFTLEYSSDTSTPTCNKASVDKEVAAEINNTAEFLASAEQENIDVAVLCVVFDFIEQVGYSNTSFAAKRAMKF